MLSLAAPLGYYRPLVPAAPRRHHQPRALVDGAALIGAAAPWVAPVVATSAAALIGAAVTRRDAPDEADEVMYGVDVPYKEAAYDPVAADAFFRKRPVATARRALQLARLSGGFILATVVDRLLKRQDEMVEQRSRELLEVVLALGPTFIKIGQALSIRQDILPAAYAAGLADLQDNVPPFSAAQGRAVIERELGIRLSDTFSEFSLEPIAAASIGQVYRGTLTLTLSLSLTPTLTLTLTLTLALTLTLSLSLTLTLTRCTTARCARRARSWRSRCSGRTCCTRWRSTCTWCARSQP